MTPQPFAPYDQKMHWGGPVGNGLPKVYVDCTDPAYAASLRGPIEADRLAAAKTATHVSRSERSSEATRRTTP